MSYLYVDTTQMIQIGLLSNDFEWISFKKFDSKQSSAKLHFYIYEILQENKLEISDVEKIFYCAGPGSYTGMRVSQGMIDVLNWQGVAFNSFYHFEIPKMCGALQGVWYANAFKGEYFVYRWSEKEDYKILVKEEELEKHLEHFQKFSFCNEKDCVGTQELIYEKSEIIFKDIVKMDQKRELYYYRSLDQEFSRGK